MTISKDFQIARVELFKVPPRWLFVKITLHNGLYGWGEPVVEGRADTVKAAVEELASYLVGQDARRIEDIWQVLYRGGFYRGGPVLMSAISGIDQALWDIRGKSLEVPVYELLGGAVRDRMKIYSWIGGDRPENVAEAARARVAAGFKAVKMNASSDMEWIDTPRKVDEIIERAALVREAVGNEIGIGLDFHGRIHRGMAKAIMKELEPVKPMFIEEPILSENNESLKVLQQMTSAPIATGERMFSRWDFKHLFEDRSVDIVQPDLSHAGGISEVRRIAAMAEAYDVAIAPHCPLGPISFAAALHLDFVSINAFIQETSMGIHYNGEIDLIDYVRNPEALKVEDGYIGLPEKPGLGLDIDEEKVIEMAKIGHTWKNPVWRNADGSFAEW
ncbi:MAG: galactonate dehydratase [Cytophagaceae bacterium SCN 52-12]|nr:MAG: galactonate dehydratase [Cytophagaceae bacterium SCN 52-12]